MRTPELLHCTSLSTQRCTAESSPAEPSQIPGTKSLGQPSSHPAAQRQPLAEMLSDSNIDQAARDTAHFATAAAGSQEGSPQRQPCNQSGMLHCLPSVSTDNCHQSSAFYGCKTGSCSEKLSRHAALIGLCTFLCHQWWLLADTWPPRHSSGHWLLNGMLAS